MALIAMMKISSRGLLLYIFSICTFTQTLAQDSQSFAWLDLPASDSLGWVDCYTGFQCANLKVPLNYSSPNNETVVLAIIQYPSPLPMNSTDYKGPLLFNPGGLGGSGVDYVLEQGVHYSQMFQNQYDIVGFDPHGVARSTRVSFYETGAERALWSYEILELLGRPDDERDTGILAHINTDQTVRDMLEITEAYGRQKLLLEFFLRYHIGRNLRCYVSSLYEILCNDGLPVPSNVEAAEEYYADLSAQFEWASIWAGVRIGCSGWPDYPKTNFRGPFMGNTNYPILFVGNTADPVTPLAAAKKIASGFDGSVVLTQDSPGHCSIAVNSPCTQGYINGMFLESDTVCPIVGTLFDNASTSDALLSNKHLCGPSW
ncbi:hypothetical protein DFS33DRAFT_1272484 [Desarmillaria ectypa]|nr:hypothetical protein DFS33DRAFT_1272484 [Desarmillaria ectypa]